MQSIVRSRNPGMEIDSTVDFHSLRIVQSRIPAPYSVYGAGICTMQSTVRGWNPSDSKRMEIDSTQTSQLSLFHSETQGFWLILKVIPSNLTVKNGQNVEPNHPKFG